MKKQAFAILSVVSTFVMLGAGPALAANGPVASTDGSTAQYIDSGNKFKICDTDSDGDWVYVKFHFTGSSGDTTIEYHGGTTGGDGGSGCITRASGVPEGVTVTYKSCQNDAFADTCSGWKDSQS